MVVICGYLNGGYSKALKFLMNNYSDFEISASLL